jgi:hypothetical protein
VPAVASRAEGVVGSPAGVEFAIDSASTFGTLSPRLAGSRRAAGGRAGEAEAGGAETPVPVALALAARALLLRIRSSIRPSARRGTAGAGDGGGAGRCARVTGGRTAVDGGAEA